MPRYLFFGIFEATLEKFSFNYYDGFLAINVNPNIRKIRYDDLREPRLIYQGFNGANPPDLEDTNYIFMEELKLDGQIRQKRMRDFSLLESFTNQV